MGKLFETIDDRLSKWIDEQHVFFVGTAPLAADGHVNLSPKGLRGTLKILGPRRIAYLDFVGSGVETIAHLRENGRIVIMLMAMSGPPKIVRLHGQGRAVLPADSAYRELRAHFGEFTGERAIIDVDVVRISDSCGYAVPRYAFRGERDTLGRWADKKGSAGLADYQREKNAASIDGLPGIDP